MVILLVGCSSDPIETSTYTMESEGLYSMQLTYTYQNDKVLTQETLGAYSYMFYGLSDKEEAEKLFTESGGIDMYAGIKGMTHTF